MLPASLAAWVPVFIATATSACASAGASLVPSPHMATRRPCCWYSRISFSLASGVASARKSSTPASAAIAAAVSLLSPVIITVRDAHAAQFREALADAALDDVLELDHAERARAIGHHQRRARPGARRSRPRAAASGGSAPPCAVQPWLDRIGRALADLAAVEVDAAHARLRAEGDELRAERLHVAPANAVLLLGQHHDRAAFGRLVGQRGQLRRIGQLRGADARRRDEARRQAIAERDGAGLVEQQHVDVAGRLDRAARRWR